MPNLLVRPGAREGRVIHVTPESAGWTYVGFEVHRLRAGTLIEQDISGREACLVPVTGRMRVETDRETFRDVGGRATPFAGKPSAVYIPANQSWRVIAETDLELAVCSAPAEGRLPARLIRPDDIVYEERGQGSNRRLVSNILPESEPAESLLVVEVVTPGGNWSSYPPHKHDCDALPEESLLEETYYHRLDPPQGFAFQRVYTESRDLDETMAVSDGDCVLVPRGYHPVGAPHGYDLYYLNVMAGPKRTWRFRNDPAHAWILNA